MAQQRRRRPSPDRRPAEGGPRGLRSAEKTTLRRRFLLTLDHPVGRRHLGVDVRRRGRHSGPEFVPSAIRIGKVASLAAANRRTTVSTTVEPKGGGGR